MNIHEWIQYGIDNGFATPAVCSTHDGIPSTEKEDVAGEDGEGCSIDIPMSAEEVTAFEEWDPCIHVVRLYQDADEKAEVELNHAPSVWRKQ